MADVYALDVQTVFRGVPIAARQVVRRRSRRRPLFVVGSTPRADAPVSPRYLGEDAGVSAASDHALVSASADGGDGDGHYLVCLAPRMTSSAGATFTLRPGEQARVDCGAVTFLLASAPRAPAIGTRGIAWRSPDLGYHLATALAVLLALLALLAVPADPRGLSLDLFERDHPWAKLLIKPPVTPPIIVAPSAPVAPRADSGGRAGGQSRGPAGAGGSQTAVALHRHAAASGHSSPSDVPRTSPTPGGISHLGVLALLSKAPAAQAIFARESAFGANAADVLGDLASTSIGEALGHLGLRDSGTGAHGADQGAPTLGGGGRLPTLGWGGGGGPDGSPYGNTVGRLARRAPTRPIEIAIGEPQVKGSLDREIIRRIIRRHLHEVKFCYEEALASHPGLGGRILMHFAIAPSGQVVTSVVESSTMGSARVEGCTAQAVRRWEFPRPLGGGMVVVSYPFVMTPAGAGD